MSETLLSVRESRCGTAVLSVVCLTVLRDGGTARGRATKLDTRSAPTRTVDTREEVGEAVVRQKGNTAATTHKCRVSCRARALCCALRVARSRETLLGVRESRCGIAVLSVVCLTVLRDGGTARGRATKLDTRSAHP